jgi:hypothetical protein
LSRCPSLRNRVFVIGPIFVNANDEIEVVSTVAPCQNLSFLARQSARQFLFHIELNDAVRSFNQMAIAACIHANSLMMTSGCTRWYREAQQASELTEKPHEMWLGQFESA